MDIQQYLKDNKVSYISHDHAPTYTAQEVAAEEHVSGHMTAKSVVVRDGDGKFALCVLPAPRKLDLDKAADVLGVKRLRLADEAEMAEIFSDVEVGAEPPFGNLYDLPTVVDGHLAEDEEIVFQAGSHRKAIRMRYEDYIGLTRPMVQDISVRL